MLFPCLTFIILNDNASKLIDKSNLSKFYYDLKIWNLLKISH